MPSNGGQSPGPMPVACGLVPWIGPEKRLTGAMYSRRVQARELRRLSPMRGATKRVAPTARIRSIAGPKPPRRQRMVWAEVVAQATSP